MTKSEQTALEELHMTPETLAEKTARAEALARGESLEGQLKASLSLQADVETHRVTPIFSRFGKCPVCNEPAIFIDRNRLANCGHVRRSHGKLVLRDDKPKAPAVAQKPGFLTPEQAARLTDLIETQESCRVELESAEATVEFRRGRLDAAQAELAAYLRELQGVK